MNLHVEVCAVVRNHENQVGTFGSRCGAGNWKDCEGQEEDLSESGPGSEGAGRENLHIGMLRSRESLSMENN